MLTEEIISLGLKAFQSTKGTCDSDFVQNNSLTPAAVLVPLVQHDASLSLILTKRAKHLKHHAGQICFPGGRYETSDLNLKQTALRETYEEIGIPSSEISLIGSLPTHKTVSGFLMTPIVGMVANSYSFNIDENEVEHAFEVPFDFVCDPNNHQKKSTFYQGKERFYYVIEFEEHYIWGATARVLVEFSRLLKRFDQIAY